MAEDRLKRPDVETRKYSLRFYPDSPPLKAWGSGSLGIVWDLDGFKGGVLDDMPIELIAAQFSH